MEISLKAQELFSIGNFGVTNSLLLTLIVSLILITFALVFKSRMKLIPGRGQAVVEILVESFLGLMDSTMGSMEKAKKYLPLVVTIFIFILTCNFLGVLPGVGSLTFGNGAENVPLLRSPAADLNFPLAFAIMAVLVTNFFGMVTVGAIAHGKKFFNFSNPMNFFVGILEFISEIAKIISFSFRLFGNVFAGEVLLAIIFFLVPYAVPIPFMILEIFFGAIQAFIFSMLTLVFLSLNTTAHEHGH